MEMKIKQIKINTIANILVFHNKKCGGLTLFFILIVKI